MKMSPGTQAERESSGFCSGEELEDPDTDSSSRSISDIESRDNKSATPSSLKSEHVPISRKRKYEDTNNNKHLDAVKRVCSFDSRLSSKKTSSSPFRPWDDSKESSPKVEYQEEPLSLVKEKKVESEEQEMPLDFRKKVFPFRSKSPPNVPEDIKPVVNTNLNFINSSYPYSMFRTNPVLASSIHQIRNPIGLNSSLLSRSSLQPAPFKPLIVHKDPLVDSIPLIPPNLLIPSPLMYSKPLVDNKFPTLNTRIKKENDIRIKEENPVHDFKKMESILRRDSILHQNGISIKQEPSDILVSKSKSKDTNRTTSNMKSINNNKSYSEKLSDSNKFIESLSRVPKKHERLEDLKMQNACISNDSTTSSCTVDSDEAMLLNDNSYKRKSSSSQNYNRNYKNMTRERRIEANARERTRVHTISAAFETLRKTVPAYSTNQKLSKLSVLRIACSYIMTLSRIAGHDYSSDQSEPSIESCVQDVTKTIQSEGKVKKKSKDDGDDDDED